MRYSKEELIELADINSQELSLIFARDMAGFSDVEIVSDGLNTAVASFVLNKKGFHVHTKLPNYITDWTATINVIEKAGMAWDKDGMFSVWKRYITESCSQKSSWGSCCALMVCAILIKQQEKK